MKFWNLGPTTIWENIQSVAFFFKITPPYRTVSCQYRCLGMPGRQAGSAVSVHAQVQCREPKTGQQKVQFSKKMKYFSNLAI